jgi:two-component system response regulator GlrR
MQERILVVEDDPIFREALLTALADAGYGTTVADGAEGALKLVDSESFALVLSEFRMPGMDGVQLFHEIRARKQVPFILMLGCWELMGARDAEGLGLSGLLSKPFHRDELIRSIRSCLDR